LFQLPRRHIPQPLRLDLSWYGDVDVETNVPEHVVIEHGLQPLVALDLRVVLAPDTRPTVLESFRTATLLSAEAEHFVVRVQQPLGPWSMPLAVSE
jgi:hypothetical protein